MKSFYNTCQECGKTYHISGCCSCELIDQWLATAEQLEERARECRAIAQRLQEAKGWKLGDGTIYREGGGVLYDCLDDWLDKAGQQILCDLMNEGWDKTPFDEVKQVLDERLANVTS